MTEFKDLVTKANVFIYQTQYCTALP